MSASYQLTKYPSGSIKESWAISWPLMLGLLSGSLMMFCDRLLLGNYSIDNMNAAASSSMASFVVLVFPIITASISEVFVGQYHGKGEYNKIFSIVVQMIWFAVFCIPVFYLAAIYIPKLFFINNDYFQLKQTYFCVMMYGGVFFVLSSALMGYFSGQGKTKLISVATILANIINLILDYCLIYKHNWGFSGLGIQGAAIATICAQFFQVMFFCYFIFKAESCWKKLCSWRLNLVRIFNCLKIGAPAGFAHTNELIVHFLFFLLLEAASDTYFTIMVLVQNIYIVLLFIGEGMSKGVTAIVANLIGAKNYSYIFKNIKSSAIIIVIFTMVLFILFQASYPDIFKLFLNSQDSMLLEQPDFSKELYLTYILTILFFLFDGIVWVLMGALTAAGDTVFIMIVNCITYWLIYLSSAYVGIKYFNLTVSGAWSIVVINSVIIMLILLVRIKKQPWIKSNIYFK